MENMTPADIAAVTRNNYNDNDGMFGGNGFFAIIILFFLFGMFGRGGFGWGGDNASAQGALTRAEMADGFNTAEIQRNQGDLMRGQFDVQREVMENRFTAQQCCCETQKEILDSRYTTQLGFQAQQANLDHCCCDLKTAIHAEAEATRDLINANTMQQLRDNLQAAQLQLGQMSQTQTLLAAINPTPRPAYLTCSPYEATVFGRAAFAASGCGCNCG